LMLAGDLGPFAYALEGGFTYRGNDADFAGAKRGSELNAAGSLGLRVLDGRLLLGPEVFGSTVVRDSDAVFAKPSTPAELIIGGHLFTSSGFRVGAGAGPGLTHGIGSPAWRGLLTVEWSAPVSPARAASKPE
jgi:OOP family OmpA-OmpF porin